MADTSPPDDAGESGGVLSLSTILVRPKINIDGAEYEIISPDELSIEQNYRVGDLGRKLDNLNKTNGLAEPQQRQLREVLDKLCAIILEPMPAEVRDALTDLHRLEIVQAFSWLLQAARLKRVGATIPRMIEQLVGESLSPGSNASTAEARTGG